MNRWLMPWGLCVAATLVATHTGNGGPVTPGGYVFISHPPYCSADFTVTP